MIPGPYRNLALTGFMGAGKTTAGERLAARLGWRFLDADTEIEREAGRPVAAIFAEDGEPAFRALEERVVERLLAETSAVVSLGGGAVLSARTRERLRDATFTVLLDVSPQTAWRRIEARAGDRPLAVEARGFAELYETRRPVYHAACDALVDADAGTGEEALVVPLARPAALADLPRLTGARRAALVADRSVLRVVGAPLQPLVTVRLPAGEAAKTVAVARQAWTRMADLGVERGDVVVGLGGGAATDVAGFVAATYLRGVPWIAVPTSLVGMVDAAIGGKTAVDLPQSKNAVGAFHQPEWVVCDPAVLETLPVREWACGFAEVVKTALLAGGRLWELVRGWGPGRGSAEERLELIRRCAAYKARIVAADPTEQGERAVLNLGHSIGHAIEVATGYSAFAHGEAVAIGLLPALWLSAQVAGLDPALEDEVRDLLRRHGLPVTARNVPPGAIVEAMARDKKARDGRVRFALLEAVGRPVFGVDPGDELVERAVARAVTRRSA
jgi:shikimate kinase / 3-dehydroquinate synthase